MKVNIRKLERARILKGWTKTKLAFAVGVTPAVIGRVESGGNNNPITIKAMCDVLGLKTEDVYQ